MVANQSLGAIVPMSLQFFSGEHNPANQDYYIGASPLAVPDTHNNYQHRVYSPIDGSVVWWSFQVRVAGILGSAELGQLDLRIGDEEVSQTHNLSGDLWAEPPLGLEGPSWASEISVLSGELLPGVCPVTKDVFLMFIVTCALSAFPTNVSYFGQVRVQP